MGAVRDIHGGTDATRDEQLRQEVAANFAAFATMRNRLAGDRDFAGKWVVLRHGRLTGIVKDDPYAAQTAADAAYADGLYSLQQCVDAVYVF